MTNASSRKDIRAAEKEAKLVEIQNRDVVIGLMSTSVGRAWVHAKLEACHMFADPFTSDPYLEAYRKGERNVGLVLLADLMLFCPDSYVEMMREANARSTVSELRRSKDSSGGDQGPEPDDGDSDSAYNGDDRNEGPGLFDYN